MPALATPTNTPCSTTSTDFCRSARNAACGLVVVQGGADGADPMAREWVLYNKKISSGPIETIANPNYLVARRL